MASYFPKLFICPYYKWDERLCVHCEGGKISFPDTQSANAYKESFCASSGGWEKCTVSLNLTKYYDRTQGEKQ